MDFFNLDLKTIWDETKGIFFPEVDFGDPLNQEVGLSFSGDAGQASADRADSPMLGGVQIPAWVWPVGIGLLALVVARPLLK